MSKWLDILKHECAQRTQADVAAELKVSPAVINQVLKGIYKGRTNRIKSLVEGRYMGATVECPIIGDIPRNRCIEHQLRRTFAATNPLRVQLYKKCPTCPNFQHGRES